MNGWELGDSGPETLSHSQLVKMQIQSQRNNRECIKKGAIFNDRNSLDGKRGDINRGITRM